MKNIIFRCHFKVKQLKIVVNFRYILHIIEEDTYVRLSENKKYNVYCSAITIHFAKSYNIYSAFVKQS